MAYQVTVVDTMVYMLVGAWFLATIGLVVGTLLGDSGKRLASFSFLVAVLLFMVCTASVFFRIFYDLIIQFGEAR